MQENQRLSLTHQLRAAFQNAISHLLTIRQATGRRLRQPPNPWVTLLVAATSATFAGLNYFKVPRGSAVLMLDRFDPMDRSIDLPGLGKQAIHNLRLWLSNTGQAPANLQNVSISTEFYSAPLDGAAELQRMKYVAKNKDSIGSNFTNQEITPGQKMYFTSHAAFADQSWSEFQSRNQLLYVFALITFTDEKSGGAAITKEICARVDPDLTWANCKSGHNQTVR